MSDKLTASFRAMALSRHKRTSRELPRSETFLAAAIDRGQGALLGTNVADADFADVSPQPGDRRMKLFAIYIGGDFARANIEVHDMRFVVAPSIEETYDELRRQWWGVPGSLHIDCWAEIDHADGYDVSLRAEHYEGPERLYYVNLGGYEPAEFSERHRNMFVVADSVAKAKARALASVKHWDAPHRDDLYEAEQAFALDRAAGEQRLHIHLTPADEERPMRFFCEYMPLKGRAKAPLTA